MQAFVTIDEDNRTHSWVSNIDVPHKPPMVGSICWVEADSDDALVVAAKAKFHQLGFDIISTELVTKSEDDKTIKLIVKEISGVDEIPSGSGKLQRKDLAQGWPFH